MCADSILHEQGIAAANVTAEVSGLGTRAEFHTGDAAAGLPFADANFDAVTCIDAINHFPDRPDVLAAWQRVLNPGGWLLFTDPCVLTGPVTSEELAIRASIGQFVFVPPGVDEALLAQAGFVVERVVDRTANMAANAAGWLRARTRREAELAGGRGRCGVRGAAALPGDGRNLGRRAAAVAPGDPGA